MDVTFVLEDETAFCIRVDVFENFQEIKERIKKSTNIPVDRQTLLFNGQVLQDEAFFIDSNISPFSLVEVLVQPNENDYDLPQWIRNASKLDVKEMQEMLSSISEPQTMSFTTDTTKVLTENPDGLQEFISSMMDAPPEEPVPQVPLPNKVMFTVKSLDLKRKPLLMRMSLNDTVLQLKEQFFRDKKPKTLQVMNMVVLTKQGDELHDHMSMLECGMLNMSHVYMCKRSEGGGLIGFDLKKGKMLKVMVVPKGGTEKIPIEVNSHCHFEDLRFELEKFHKHVVPSVGYFFTFNDIPAPERFSFIRLRIKEGDTLVINPHE